MTGDARTESPLRMVRVPKSTLHLPRAHWVDFPGEHVDKDGLHSLLVEKFVPYKECYKKCSRYDTCRFRAEGRKDPKCGFLAQVLRNFVEATYEIACGLDADGMKSYLLAAGHISEFAYDAEYLLGEAVGIDAGAPGYVDYGRILFGRLAKLRSHLDSLAKELGTIEKFADIVPDYVILVEGEAEEAFLKSIFQIPYSTLLGREVRSYGGGGRLPARLRELASEVRARGRKLFIQRDADGKTTDQVQALVREGLVDEPDTYVFERDFETSFPLCSVYRALADGGHLDPETMTCSVLCGQLDASSGTALLSSLNAALGTRFTKPELAEVMATYFRRDSLRLRGIEESEIGRFLEKIMRLPLSL